MNNTELIIILEDLYGFTKVIKSYSREPVIKTPKRLNSNYYLEDYSVNAPIVETRTFIKDRCVGENVYIFKEQQ